MKVVFDQIIPLKVLHKKILYKILISYIEKNNINVNIDESCWISLFENEDSDYIWKFLLDNEIEKFYNLIITYQFFMKYYDYNSEFSEIEAKIYKDIDFNQVCFIMIRTLEIILSNNFNEMIKKDLDIINKNVWIGINLDSYYFIEINHINYNHILQKKREGNPRDLYKKILDISIIISTLERINDLYFYTKLNKKIHSNYPEELKNNINFTKGYLICFHPKLNSFLKKYKYSRKLINRSPKNIISLKKNPNFIESLNNENFSNKIWMNEKNISIIDLKNKSIYNKKLIKKSCNIKICLSTLNFLNSIEIIYDKESFDILFNILRKNENIDSSLTHKNVLINIILKISNDENEKFTEITYDLKTLIQSASILELIYNQIGYYNSFFFDHRLDHRLRIYCYPWPINYQLNHIVRNVILFKKKTEINIIWDDFKNHPLIKKYVDNIDIFEYNKNQYIKNKIEDLYKKYNLNSKSEIEEETKKEYIYQILLKISPKYIKKIEDKIDFSIKIHKEFIDSNLEEEWSLWIKKLGIKEKKLPYIINYQKSLKDITENIFNNIFWADASSNAIQLIILRLNMNNDFLLKLVNIIDNDTEYTNIYEYITEKIKKKNHSEIIKKLNNTISEEEINLLQENDNNKYLLMPSSYGMGKKSYRKKLNAMISSDDRKNIWDRLLKKEKETISDYFWECAKEILIEIDFDIEKYKKICKIFYTKEKKDIYIWKNDLNITISPISIINSNRDVLLKKLNNLKKKKEDIINEQIIKEIEDEIKKINEELKKNDKEFWKRSMIITKKNKIFSRIYFKKKFEINKREIEQSLIPNTIHAYDASIMHLTIQICKKLNIEILVIHDSIGCNALNLPLVKTIFKVANILIMDINRKKIIFPFTEKNEITDKEFKEKKKKILESKNFFR